MSELIEVITSMWTGVGNKMVTSMLHSAVMFTFVELFRAFNSKTPSSPHSSLMLSVSLRVSRILISSAHSSLLFPFPLILSPLPLLSPTPTHSVPSPCVFDALDHVLSFLSGAIARRRKAALAAP
eukprot:757386-Hanusia_phi.AAC.3